MNVEAAELKVVEEANKSEFDLLDLSFDDLDLVAGGAVIGSIQ